jgi:hypothetical protein
MSVETQSHYLTPPKRVKDMDQEEYATFRRDYMKAWRDANRCHFREKCRIHSKKYYETHKEQVLEGKKAKRVALTNLQPIQE